MLALAVLVRGGRGGRMDDAACAEDSGACARPPLSPCAGDASDAGTVADAAAATAEAAGDYAGAGHHYDNVVRALRATVGTSPSDVACALCDAARSFRAAGDLPAAVARYEEARAIEAQLVMCGGSIAGNDRAVTLRGLAELRVTMGSADQAVELYQEALDLEKMHHGDADSVDVAWTLLGLGEALLAAGRPADAIPPLGRAFHIHRRVPSVADAVHPLSAVLHALAGALRQCGKPGDAVRCYREEVSLREAAGPASEALMVAMLGTASTLREMHAHPEALGEYCKLLSELRTCEDVHLRACVPDVLRHVGDTHMELGDAAAALGAYEAELRELRCIHAANLGHPVIGDCVRCLFRARAAQNKVTGL